MFLMEEAFHQKTHLWLH